MPDVPATPSQAHRQQHTLAGAVSFRGVGMHSGEVADLTLRPADPDSGIVFRRSDLAESASSVGADWRNVVDSYRVTTIGDGGKVNVAIIEHLMGALAACGVDNAVIDVSRRELPAMDGSAAPFVAAIADTGLAAQGTARRAVKVLEPVAVGDGDRRLSVAPDDHLSIGFEIDYPGSAIGRQSFDADPLVIDFRAEICPARTFCTRQEAEAFRARGLARGGSLENTLVVDGDGLLNDTGLRYPEEFVRHKILDCLGDLYLLGRPLIGRVEGSRSGHATTHALMAALMNDEEAWAITEIDA